MNKNADKVAQLNQRFAKSAPAEILEWAIQTYGEQLRLACSLSVEDTTLLHIAARISKKVRVFVLDTGRLHEKSYELLERCRQKYKLMIECYFPNTQKAQELVTKKGLYSFYESVAQRKECCSIRKVEPLQRALSGASAWVTGQRREQSAMRAKTPLIEVDRLHDGILKINPLANWSWQQVLNFASENQVPVHPLHHAGYPSIGCEPCTRAIAKGEDLRAGRWWWEAMDKKECGMHAQ